MNKTLTTPVRQPPLNAREELAEFFKTALIAIILALLIRGFLYEPFNIPSGSMKPTLEVGDYIFTDKRAYGYGQYSFSLFYNLFLPVPYQGRVWATPPQRGDIVVFWLPSHGQNYIKRVIGLPGERIQVRQGRLYINEQMVPRAFIGVREEQDPVRGTVVLRAYREILPGGVVHQIYEESDEDNLDNTPVYVVPEGQYFMMGDNRDNSQDSRVTHQVGPVPFENMIGRAETIFFSTNGNARLFEVWKWPWAVRYERLFMNILPLNPAPPGE
ncbi:MAG: signal peptidase I [Alphaproteobacteria bacterium]|nr:signal peptidase I [Alphaproteobacteria bacterium]